MGQHKRNKNTVTRDARRAFAVAREGMAAEGERIGWAINAMMGKHPGTPIEDIIVCVDEPGSLNHQIAERAKHTPPGVPFVHARLRSNSGCHEVKTTAPPKGRLWMQIGLTSANGMNYEAAPVQPIVVGGFVCGLYLADADFDRGAQLFAGAQ